MNKVDIKTELAGRWHSVLISIGFPADALNGKHQACPMPGCGGKDRYRWDRRKETLFCSCCGHKSGIETAMAWLGMSYKETAQYLRPHKENYKMETLKAPDTAQNEARLKKIHAGLVRIHSDSPAAAYLAKRGITVLPETDCYMHPALDYYQDGKSIGKFPALVSKFRTIDGDTSTFHITYLTSDGNKLDVDAAKKILPAVRTITGSAIRLFPATETLAICEGIESALAFYQDNGFPTWAAGNANNMAAMEIPDSVKHVIIAADSDANFVGQAAAYALARRLQAKGDRLSVKVVLLVDTEQVIDSGIPFDFNDYAILNAAA